MLIWLKAQIHPLSSPISHPPISSFIALSLLLQRDIRWQLLRMVAHIEGEYRYLHRFCLRQSRPQARKRRGISQHIFRSLYMFLHRQSLACSPLLCLIHFSCIKVLQALCHCPVYLLDNYDYVLITVCCRSDGFVVQAIAVSYRTNRNKILSCLTG